MTESAPGRFTLRNAIVEITQACNHDCRYCYNVWKAARPYPQGQLDTEGTMRLLHRVVDETGCKTITISGGEPLLRQDLPQLIEGIRPRLEGVNLISNASLLTPERASELMKAGVDLFEISFLDTRPAVSNGLTRADTHTRVTDHLIGLKEAGARVVTVFVATRENLPDLENVVKFNAAVGVDGMMFNRFNPGGEGMRHARELMPSLDELCRALELLEGYAAKGMLGITCSIPMMPCLFDMSKYPHLGYGFCLGADEGRSYYTFDPLGNIRICNHSHTILGNILEGSFQDVLKSDYVSGFRSRFPSFCGDCADSARCQGGCRAASEVCSGDLCAEEPFLASVPVAHRAKP